MWLIYINLLGIRIRNFFARAKYVALDTYIPPIDVFYDCKQEDSTKIEGGETKKSKIKRLREEHALAFHVDDKLKMIRKNTQLQGPGGIALLKMRNLKSNKEGLILANQVAKIGTMESKKYVLYLSCDNWNFELICMIDNFEQLYLW